MSVAEWLRVTMNAIADRVRTRYSPVETPWGPSQYQESKADGIVFYGTAGHGGYGLSRERQAEVKALFPNFATFAGGCWYEEDQDCAVVVLAFSRLYADDELRAAVRIARVSAKPWSVSGKTQRYPKWESVVEWLDGSSVEALEVRVRVQAWELANAHMWECGSMSTSGNGWAVSLTRVGDGAKKWVQFAKGEYPHGFYSDEDLRRLAVG